MMRRINSWVRCDTVQRGRSWRVGKSERMLIRIYSGVVSKVNNPLEENQPRWVTTRSLHGRLVPSFREIVKIFKNLFVYECKQTLDTVSRFRDGTVCLFILRASVGLSCQGPVIGPSQSLPMHST